MTNEFKVPLASIFTSPSMMVRAEIDPEVIDEYAAAYKRGDKFPPLDVFKEDGGYLIADGWHRFEAAKLAAVGKQHLVIIHKGTRQDALKFALKANTNHGMRRTNGDKNKCADIVIREWPKLSNAELARIAGVSDYLIAQRRPEPEKDEKRVGVDGKERPANLKALEVEKSKPIENQGSRKNESPKVLRDTNPTSPKSTTQEKDETGCVLTPSALESWGKREAVQSFMSRVKKMKSEFELVKDDPIWMNRQGIITKLDSLHFAFSECKPHAVCIECGGYPEKQPKGVCAYCGINGVMPQYKYTEALKSTIAETREKAKRGRP